MRVPPPWLVVVCLGIAAGPSTFNACLESSEYRCENAVSHLRECCPGIDVTYLRCINGYSCESMYGSHVLHEEDSNCILSLNCEQIRSQDICARALREELPYYPDGGTVPTGALCR
jgi:hypothetical protein